MSVVFVCDREGCGVGALGTFDGAGWNPPPGWHSLVLDDWEIHGCTDECFATALSETSGKTPASATHAWASLRGIRFGPRPSRRAPPSNLEVPQKPELPPTAVGPS